LMTHHVNRSFFLLGHESFKLLDGLVEVLHSMALGPAVLVDLVVVSTC
jgi:hypothetical protein